MLTTGNKGKMTKCSRGHKFMKNKEYPVCPICWPGYYGQKSDAGFPKLGAPAMRALANADIIKLKDLSKITETELKKMHGMGPSGIKQLLKAMKAAKISFRKD